MGADQRRRPSVSRSVRRRGEQGRMQLGIVEAQPPVTPRSASRSPDVVGEQRAPRRACRWPPPSAIRRRTAAPARGQRGDHREAGAQTRPPARRSRFAWKPGAPRCSESAAQWRQDPLEPRQEIAACRRPGGRRIGRQSGRTPPGREWQLLRAHVLRGRRRSPARQRADRRAHPSVHLGRQRWRRAISTTAASSSAITTRSIEGCVRQLARGAAGRRPPSTQRPAAGCGWASAGLGCGHAFVIDVFVADGGHRPAVEREQAAELRRVPDLDALVRTRRAPRAAARSGMP